MTLLSHKRRALALVSRLRVHSQICALWGNTRAIVVRGILNPDRAGLGNRLALFIRGTQNDCTVAIITVIKDVLFVGQALVGPNFTAMEVDTAIAIEPLTVAIIVGLGVSLEIPNVGVLDVWGGLGCTSIVFILCFAVAGNQSRGGVNGWRDGLRVRVLTGLGVDEFGLAKGLDRVGADKADDHGQSDPGCDLHDENRIMILLG